MNSDRAGYAIGGGVMMGIGGGFFLLQTMGAMAFVGSILLGIGLGLLVAAIISKK